MTVLLVLSEGHLTKHGQDVDPFIKPCTMASEAPKTTGAALVARLLALV
jgi:hypothetical protein